jgi:hypothetical protein
VRSERKTKDEPQAGRRRLDRVVRSLNGRVKAWDVVELEGFTSLFRTYSLPPKCKAGRWLFACIFADTYVTEIHMGEKVKVKKIVTETWQKAFGDEYAVWGA